MEKETDTNIHTSLFSISLFPLFVFGNLFLNPLCFSYHFSLMCSSHLTYFHLMFHLSHPLSYTIFPLVSSFLTLSPYISPSNSSTLHILLSSMSTSLSLNPTRVSSLISFSLSRPPCLVRQKASSTTTKSNHSLLLSYCVLKERECERLTYLKRTGGKGKKEETENTQCSEYFLSLLLSLNQDERRS